MEKTRDFRCKVVKSYRRFRFHHPEVFIPSIVVYNFSQETGNKKQATKRNMKQNLQKLKLENQRRMMTIRYFLNMS